MAQFTFVPVALLLGAKPAAAGGLPSPTNQDDMEKRKMAREEMLKAFRLFDDDETGKISFRNLKRVAKELGENMTDDEIQEMIEEADRDGDGEISEEEFMRIMRKTNLF